MKEELSEEELVKIKDALKGPFFSKSEFLKKVFKEDFELSRKTSKELNDARKIPESGYIKL